MKMRYRFKSWLFLLLLLVQMVSYGAPNIAKETRFNGNPPQMVVDFDGVNTPKYRVEYDDMNRLLFVEFYNSKAADSFVDKNINGTYIEKIDVVRYPNSVAVFLYLKKNVNYKVSKRTNPMRVVVDFSKKTSKKEYTIVVDAGHGGKDGGSIGFKKYLEKDIVLGVSKYLRQELGKDFNVIMTRSKDEFISLNERARIGNRNSADLFVSIHANAVNGRAAGFEIFYYSKKSSPYAAKVAAFENSFGNKYGEDISSIARVKGETEYNINKTKSIEIAENIIRTYPTKLGMKDRGIHGANFAVLRGFNGPGILVELGFMTDSKDVWKMKQSKYQKIMAKEIANGIRKKFY